MGRLTESTSVERGGRERQKRNPYVTDRKGIFRFYFSILSLFWMGVEIAQQMVKDEEIITLSPLYFSFSSSSPVSCPNPNSPSIESSFFSPNPTFGVSFHLLYPPDSAI
ncbi:hypothetical protein Bca4012_002734 [Brassica carinata]